MSAIRYRPPITGSDIITVNGQIEVAELKATGSHTPIFTIPGGANGRQWLFVFYNIQSVNILWPALNMFLDGDTFTYNDRTSLNTSDAGGSSISYTAAHRDNNSTLGNITFSWTGVPLLTGGPFVYSIIYRNI